MPHADPIAKLREQRKFAMFLIVMVPVAVGALCLVAFVALQVFRGKMSLEAATGFMFGSFALALVGAVAMGQKVIDANTAEDTARIDAAAPKPPMVSQAIASGEGAQATQVDAANAEVVTPAESPQAKR